MREGGEQMGNRRVRGGREGSRAETGGLGREGGEQRGSRRVRGGRVVMQKCRCHIRI